MEGGARERHTHHHHSTYLFDLQCPTTINATAIPRCQANPRPTIFHLPSYTILLYPRLRGRLCCKGASDQIEALTISIRRACECLLGGDIFMGFMCLQPRSTWLLDRVCPLCRAVLHLNTNTDSRNHVRLPNVWRICPPSHLLLLLPLRQPYHCTDKYHHL